MNEITGEPSNDQFIQPMALKDYVVLVSDALPADFMQELINAAEEDGNWTAGTIRRSDLDPEVRACDVMTMSDGMGASLQRHRTALLRFIRQCGQLYVDRFPWFNGEGLENPQLIRYGVDQFYREHVDHGHLSRKLSVSITLNDGYQGGEFSLFQGRLKLSTKPGDVLMFPSNFLFPHSVEPIYEGTRYAVVTWLR
ncbi:MAG: 2OG-Fe(II) oxygenase family protein [Gammaproteobacteria bacterium]